MNGQERPGREFGFGYAAFPEGNSVRARGRGPEREKERSQLTGLVTAGTVLAPRQAGSGSSLQGTCYGVDDCGELAHLDRLASQGPHPPARPWPEGRKKAGWHARDGALSQDSQRTGKRRTELMGVAKSPHQLGVVMTTKYS